jgi:Flp pilus assembly protein TadD
LAEFLEAMYSAEELGKGLNGKGSSGLSDSRYAMALAETSYGVGMRSGLEAMAADGVMQYVSTSGEEFAHYIGDDEVSPDLKTLSTLRERLKKCKTHDLTLKEQEALVGAVKLTTAKKEKYVKELCETNTAKDVITEVKEHLERERRELLRYGLSETDLPLFFHARVLACMPLPQFTPKDVPSLTIALRNTSTDVSQLVWRVMGLRSLIKIENEVAAKDWLEWGTEFASKATSHEWANVAGTLRHANMTLYRQHLVDKAFEIGESARAWMEKAELLHSNTKEQALIEEYYHHALLLDSEDSIIWGDFGIQLAASKKLLEAETAFRRAAELSPMNAKAMCNLATVYIAQNKLDKAQKAALKATKLDPNATEVWHSLGLIYLVTHNFEKAEIALNKAINLDANNLFALANLGNVYRQQDKVEEAITVFRQIASLDRNWLPILQTNLNLAYIQLFAQRASRELDETHPQALKELLHGLASDVSDLSQAFTSEHYIEGFLALTLKQKYQATFVLDVLREMNADRFARPLLIAFEAAIEGKASNLDELEPELQRAAKRMYERLTAKHV